MVRHSERNGANRSRTAWWLALIAGGLLVHSALVRDAAAQTIGFKPHPTIIDDCGNVQGICCPGPLIWGFDPYGGCDHCSDCLGDCRTGFIAHRPSSWYGAVDIVALTVNRSDPVEFARVGPTGDAVLTTSSLRPEYNAGNRVTIGRTFGGCVQIDASFLGNFGWQDSQLAASAAGDLSSILTGFTDPADAVLDNNNLVSVSLASKMTTAEVNVRTWLQMQPSVFDIQVLAGLRYFAASDQLQFHSQGTRANLADIAQNDVSVATDNDLYGLQVGTNAKWLLHRLCYLNFEGKVALCENFVTQSTSYVSTDGNGVAAAAITTNNSTSRTTLLGDLQLTCAFQIRPNWAVQFGYQALFVNGLATAPQNLPSNSFLLNNGIGQFRDDGNLVYHGPTLGMVGAW
ncbi:MAG: BBP7 family outer membrane beta-barrel protein [Pirellulales bacterium]